MRAKQTFPTDRRIPEGYRMVPLGPAEEAASLRLCILLRHPPDAGTGALVLLRALFDGTVYLGGITDRAGRIHDWIEIWVQSSTIAAQSSEALAGRINNAMLDQRWCAMAEAWTALPDPAELIATGWEIDSPPPLFVDAEAGQAWIPTLDGVAWRLCMNDALLRAHSLPTYGNSLHRYWAMDTGTEMHVLPATPGAPGVFSPGVAAQVAGEAQRMVPVNPEGGHMLVRRYAALSLEEYRLLLEGRPWTGLQEVRASAMPLSWRPALADTEHPDALFLSAGGVAARRLEVFFLKIRLFRQMVQAVRNSITATGRPFLNLRPESFRVFPRACSIGLPTLWAAEVACVDPGCAVELALEGSAFRAFLPAAPRPGEFLPPGLGNTEKGEGTLIVQEIQDQPDLGHVVSGVLSMTGFSAAASHAWVWVCPRLARTHPNMVGTLQRQTGSAEPLLFSSLPAKLSAAELEDLRGAGPARLPCTVEWLPSQSAGADCYSLAVLGAWLLVGGSGHSTASVVEALSNMGRDASGLINGHALREATPEVATRIRQNDTWAHRLSSDHLLPGVSSLQPFPASLWTEALLILAAMLPGHSRFAYCREYGSPEGAVKLETVFDGPLRDLDALLVAIRTWMLADWERNQEVHSLLAEIESV